jgi:protein-tyrosine phosphatase
MRLLRRSIAAGLLVASQLLPAAPLRAALKTGPYTVHAQATAAAQRSATHERHIALSGAANFRDLGGYETGDGRHVRWGLVYRSGELSHLTPADYERLAALGISAVCDFRRDSERNAAPTNWIGSTPPAIFNVPGAQAERSPAGAGRGSGRAGQPPAAAAPVPALSPLLMSSYPTYPTALASSYKTVIQQIMAGRGAVLYHCTAGKDRTGTFSALLLTMLGVPRATVMQDYLLSNEYVATPARVNAMVARGATREAAIANIGVDRTYLDLMFAAIDKEYGSFDAYRRQALGISDADLTALQAKLLE